MQFLLHIFITLFAHRRCASAFHAGNSGSTPGGDASNENRGLDDVSDPLFCIFENIF